MIYDIKDKLPFNKLVLFSIQMMLSVFTATALIAQICGVNMSGALFGAGFSTVVYQWVTKGKSPMFMSNSGNYLAPVLTALAVGGYTAVAIGGLVSFIVYSTFGLIFSKVSIDKLYQFMPKVLIGSVTVVIGINLMGFIPTYIGNTGNVGVIIALITVLAIALSSHYLKGVLSMFPFLIGTLVGYVVSIPFGLVDFSKFDNIRLFVFPDFAFGHFIPVDLVSMLPVIVIYIAFTVSAICECLSDHAALSGIIGHDLYKEPGLTRIFVGEGVANLATSLLGGLGACSYGEGVACVGFSKCASTYVTNFAGILLMLLGCFEPIQAFIASIPSCVFAGCAIVLYSFISLSGIKVLKTVDLDNMKNILISGAVLSLGICGICLGSSTISITGVALALFAGISLNLVLKEN